MSNSNLNDKLSHNCYLAPSQPPSIVLVSAPQRAQLTQLLFACPAGLYQQTTSSEIIFEPNGCLECGTCRILCDHEVMASWRYPGAGHGVIFRFG